MEIQPGSHILWHMGSDMYLKGSFLVKYDRFHWNDYDDDEDNFDLGVYVGTNCTYSIYKVKILTLGKFWGKESLNGEVPTSQETLELTWIYLYFPIKFCREQLSH